MGEGTNGLDEPVAPEELEKRVALIRAHMTDVVSELDYRRHELLDVKAQLQRHAGKVAVVGGVLLLLGAGLGYQAYHARRERAERGRRLFAARVAQPELALWRGLALKGLSAAAGALVTVGIKALVVRVLRPALKRGAAPPPALPDFD